MVAVRGFEPKRSLVLSVGMDFSGCSSGRLTTHKDAACRPHLKEWPLSLSAPNTKKGRVSGLLLHVTAQLLTNCPPIRGAERLKVLLSRIVSLWTNSLVVLALKVRFA